MKAKGFPATVGYLDDFWILTESEAECWVGYQLIIRVLRDLGFEVNEEKCDVPAQRVKFLGVWLDTNADGMGRCTATIPEDKLKRAVDQCRAFRLGTRHTVRLLQQTVGLLIFCSQVVEVSGLFLRSAFSALKCKGSHFSVERTLALDMAWWARVLTTGAPVAAQADDQAGTQHRVMPVLCIDKREVLPVDFALDASSEIGMGGFLEGDYFAVTWRDIRGRQQKPVYPFRDEASSHINYLELFAVYWALVTWGPRLRECRVQVKTDSTTVLSMLRGWWGQATFIPLLREIFIICRRWDIKLVPEYVNTKVNVLPDSLSRQRWGEFRQALTEWRTTRRSSRDADDWMLLPEVFADLDQAFGPFQVEACTDDQGANAHLSHFAERWTRASDARLADWTDRRVFCNPPFSDILPILLRFLQCKQECPRGTSAVFVLPRWEGEAFLDLVREMPLTFVKVRSFETGSSLFTAPVTGRRERRFCGVTRWPVDVYFVGPSPLRETVRWGSWGRFVFRPGPSR